MPKATWNGAVIADSDDTVVVEGNHYFPEDSLDNAHFEASRHTTVCAWKGTAHYYNVRVGDRINENAAWFYPDPKPQAAEIKDRVAFWKGVTVNG
jgi:uncharacterized protein (DUF427 family)